MTRSDLRLFVGAQSDDPTAARPLPYRGPPGAALPFPDLLADPLTRAIVEARAAGRLGIPNPVIGHVVSTLQTRGAVWVTASLGVPLPAFDGAGIRYCGRRQFGRRLDARQPPSRKPYPFGVATAAALRAGPVSALASTRTGQRVEVVAGEAIRAGSVVVLGPDGCGYAAWSCAYYAAVRRADLRRRRGIVVGVAT